MKKHLLGLVKGKMWRIPLSLSLFLLAPNVQSSEIQMETMNTISVQFSNVSLSEAMSQIEKASGYSFFYDANKVDLSVRVSLNASNESLREVLNTILDSTGLTYEISQNQILLYPRNSRNNSNSIADNYETQQSKKVIKGKILDASGQPIIGANIVEKGTTNGTISDMDGLFTLDVSDQAVLEVSYIGFVSQSVRVTGSGDLTITLTQV